jgi:hypothetical protein
MKYFLIPVMTILLSACGGEGGSDGDASTYDTCQITQSSALFSADRAKDVSQCWTIRATEDKNNALAQCETLASNYIAREYMVGHSVDYQVSSSSCP